MKLITLLGGILLLFLCGQLYTIAHLENNREKSEVLYTIVTDPANQLGNPYYWKPQLERSIPRFVEAFDVRQATVDNTVLHIRDQVKLWTQNQIASQRYMEKMLKPPVNIVQELTDPYLKKGIHWFITTINLEDGLDVIADDLRSYLYHQQNDFNTHLEALGYDIIQAGIPEPAMYYGFTPETYQLAEETKLAFTTPSPNLLLRLLYTTVKEEREQHIQLLSEAQRVLWYMVGGMCLLVFLLIWRKYMFSGILLLLLTSVCFWVSGVLNPALSVLLHIEGMQIRIYDTFSFQHMSFGYMSESFAHIMREVFTHSDGAIIALGIVGLSGVLLIPLAKLGVSLHCLMSKKMTKRQKKLLDLGGISLIEPLILVVMSGLTQVIKKTSASKMKLSETAQISLQGDGFDVGLHSGFYHFLIYVILSFVTGWLIKTYLFAHMREILIDANTHLVISKQEYSQKNK